MKRLSQLLLLLLVLSSLSPITIIAKDSTTTCYLVAGPKLTSTLYPLGLETNNSVSYFFATPDLTLDGVEFCNAQQIPCDSSRVISIVAGSSWGVSFPVLFAESRDGPVRETWTAGSNWETAYAYDSEYSYEPTNQDTPSQNGSITFQFWNQCTTGDVTPDSYDVKTDSYKVVVGQANTEESHSLGQTVNPPNILHTQTQSQEALGKVSNPDSCTELASGHPALNDASQWVRLDTATPSGTTAHVTDLGQSVGSGCPTACGRPVGTNSVKS